MTGQMKKTSKLKRRQVQKPSIDEVASEAKKWHQRSMAKERVNIGVSIKSELWRRLRALAITEGRLTGDLLDAAIKEYLDNHEK